MRNFMGFRQFDRIAAVQALVSVCAPLELIRDYGFLQYDRCHGAANELGAMLPLAVWRYRCRPRLERIFG